MFTLGTIHVIHHQGKRGVGGRGVDAFEVVFGDVNYECPLHIIHMSTIILPHGILTHHDNVFDGIMLILKREGCKIWR